MQKNTGKNIFISYRKQDTSGETGRLVDALSQCFHENQIFRDIEGLEPGSDFSEELSKRLQTCDVMLAIIGPNWLGKRDGRPPRIQDQNDWVRVELATALQRNIRVVPVLVNSAQLPSLEELPPELQPLLRRQAHEISNSRWRYDTEQLIDFLIHKVGITTKITEHEQAIDITSSVKLNTRWVYVLGGLFVVVVLFFIISNAGKRETTITDNGRSTSFPTIISNENKKFDTIIKSVEDKLRKDTNTHSSRNNISLYISELINRPEFSSQKNLETKNWPELTYIYTKTRSLIKEANSRIFVKEEKARLEEIINLLAQVEDEITYCYNFDSYVTWRIENLDNKDEFLKFPHKKNNPDVDFINKQINKVYSLANHLNKIP